MKKKDLPVVTAGQMKEIDDFAVQNGLFVMQMMEHAALQMARFVQEQYPNIASVVLVCGPGLNGADGIACARILSSWGYHVSLLFSHPESKLTEIALHHLAMAQKMKIPIHFSSDENSQSVLKRSDVIIDALLGYSLQGDPREPIAALIRQINALPKPVIAFDNPSGLDVTSGKPSRFCVKADETLTLGLPKKGLLEKSAQEYVGRLFLADLTIPSFVFHQFGLYPPADLFKTSTLLKL